jgi:hypothetical protein
MEKKLNSNIIKGAFEKEYKKKKVVVELAGEKYTILIDEKFRNTKIMDLIYEAFRAESVLEGQSNNVKDAYYVFLVIKYFTDLDIAQTDDIYEQLNIMSIMIDLDILNKIMAEFDTEEIKRAIAMISNFSKNMVAAIEEEAKE